MVQQHTNSNNTIDANEVLSALTGKGSNPSKYAPVTTKGSHIDYRDIRDVVEDTGFGTRKVSAADVMAQALRGLS